MSPRYLAYISPISPNQGEPPRRGRGPAHAPISPRYLAYISPISPNQASRLDTGVALLKHELAQTEADLGVASHAGLTPTLPLTPNLPLTPTLTLTLTLPQPYP